jgi:hypothetical protein
MTASDSNTEHLFALDHGFVHSWGGAGWNVDRSTKPSQDWLAELRAAGLTPLVENSAALQVDKDTQLRVVPLGLHPHVLWSTDSSTSDAVDQLHEEILPPLRGDPDEMHGGGGGVPGWARVSGKLVKWAGGNLVWDVIKGAWVIASGA